LEALLSDARGCRSGTILESETPASLSIAWQPIAVAADGLPASGGWPGFVHIGAGHLPMATSRHRRHIDISFLLHIR